MSAKVKLGLLTLAVVTMAACPLAALAEEGEGVFTVFRVLVGRPPAPAAEGEAVLIVPGSVVVLGERTEQDTTDVLQLMAKLKDVYRLGEVTLAATAAKTLVPNEWVTLPAFLGELEIRARLLGGNETIANIGVEIREGGKVVAAPLMGIRRGDRGIAGSQDGASAPYLFVTVEPMKAVGPVRHALAGGGEITPPKLVGRVTPTYPEEARKARVDGVVLVEATVGADGAVTEVTPVRSEPMGLTEAALAAVKQWRYEPARDAAGTAVPVTMTVTISFLLDRCKPAKATR